MRQASKMSLEERKQSCLKHHVLENDLKHEVWGDLYSQYLEEFEG